MLGQPYYMAIPEVIGVRMIGELKPGVTATDLVLHVTEMLQGIQGRGEICGVFRAGNETACCTRSGDHRQYESRNMARPWGFFRWMKIP